MHKTDLQAFIGSLKFEYQTKETYEFTISFTMGETEDSYIEIAVTQFTNFDFYDQSVLIKERTLKIDAEEHSSKIDDYTSMTYLLPYDKILWVQEC